MHIYFKKIQKKPWRQILFKVLKHDETLKKIKVYYRIRVFC